MCKVPLFTLLAWALLTAMISCNSSTNHLPPPVYSVENCQTQGVLLNFQSETYSIDGMPFEPFNQKIVGWIPDEGDPTFYLISYHLEFCDFLELNLKEYSYQLEEIGNPDGYWYEITTSEEEFLEILDGKIVKAKFKKWTEETVPPEFEEPNYD